jgi:hypothetical protein
MKTGTLKKEGLCNMIRDMQKKVPVTDLFAADGQTTDDEKVQQTAAKIMRKVEQVEEGRFDSLRFEDFAKIASDPTYLNICVCECLNVCVCVCVCVCDSLRFEDLAKIASDPTHRGVLQSPRYK